MTKSEQDEIRACAQYLAGFADAQQNSRLGRCAELLDLYGDTYNYQQQQQTEVKRSAT